MSVPEKDASCNRVSSLPFPHGKSHAMMNQTSKRKDHAMKKQKLLFVCHGNICRSPMAEFIMKALIRKAGCEKAITVDSVAATTEEIGNDMYPPAKRMLTKKGIPFSPRRARLITASDYARADYILCMDEENLTDLARLTRGDPEKKVSLLLSWAGRRAEVADPWYTGNFEETYEDILEGCEALLKSIRHQGVAGSW